MTVPTSTLRALVAQVLSQDAERHAVRALLEAAVRALPRTGVEALWQRIASSGAMGATERAVDYCVRHGLTLMSLLARTTPPSFTLEQLVDGGVLATADDLRLLVPPAAWDKWETWAALARLGATPRRLCKHLGLSRLLAATDALAAPTADAAHAYAPHATAFRPKDVRALGVPMEAWQPYLVGTTPSRAPVEAAAARHWI